jgi:hypothetical protein
MSDTPETDENSCNLGDKIYLSMRPDYSGDWVLSDFARKLERERDALKAELNETIKEAYRYKGEASALKELLFTLKETLTKEYHKLWF